MNFHGQEAISGPTRATGRTVLFFALLLGLAGLGWIDVADTSLLGLKIEPDKFVPLLQLLCVLSVLAHVVQWYGDYVSYRGWNVTGKMPGAGRWDAPAETKLRDLTDKITVLPEGDLDIISVKERLDEIENEINILGWNMNSFDCFAKFYVYVWHLVLPLTAAGVAIALSRYA